MAKVLCVFAEKSEELFETHQTRQNSTLLIREKLPFQMLLTPIYVFFSHTYMYETPALNGYKGILSAKQLNHLTFFSIEIVQIHVLIPTTAATAPGIVHKLSHSFSLTT